MSARDTDLRQILSGLVPADSADMSFVKDDKGEHVVVKPINANSAEMYVDYDAVSRWITLTAGFTPFELHPDGGQYLDSSQADELTQICRAVVEGKLEERLWMRGHSHVVKCVGRLRLASREVVVATTSVASLIPFRQTSVKHVCYAPY